jgi:hypothetical protein
VKPGTAKALLLWLLLSSASMFPEGYPEGIWQGYDGEWKHVSQQLIALAEATPAEKFDGVLRPESALPAKCTCISWQPIFGC